MVPSVDTVGASAGVSRVAPLHPNHMAGRSPSAARIAMANPPGFDLSAETGLTRFDTITMRLRSDCPRAFDLPAPTATVGFSVTAMGGRGIEVITFMLRAPRAANTPRRRFSPYRT